MSKGGNRLFKVATIIVLVVILIIAGYIMIHGLGLNENLDFGAGAYYYADIPNFDKVLKEDSYESSLPMWAAIVLFLLWGFLMYRLWIWIDKKNNK